MQELRTTSGQRVAVSYDPARNALTFREIEWFADSVRLPAPVAKADRRPCDVPRPFAPVDRITRRR